jgi:hypothetical protein
MNFMMEHALGMVSVFVSAKSRLTIHFLVDPTVLGLGQMKMTTVTISSQYRQQLARLGSKSSTSWYTYMSDPYCTGEPVLLYSME